MLRMAEQPSKPKGFDAEDLSRLLKGADPDVVADAMANLALGDAATVGEALSSVIQLAVTTLDKQDENRAQIEILKTLAFGKFIRTVISIISFVIKLTPVGRFAAIALVAFVAIESLIDNEEVPSPQDVGRFIKDLGLQDKFRPVIDEVSAEIDEIRASMEQQLIFLGDALIGLNREATNLMDRVQTASQHLQGNLIPIAQDLRNFSFLVGSPARHNRAELDRLSEKLVRTTGNIESLVDPEQNLGLDNVLSNIILIFESVRNKPAVFAERIKATMAQLIQ